MSDPWTAAGATKVGSHYAAATMGGRQFTGEWTQAGPYSDAAVQYLLKKFYGGSRFDRIVDGINREIGAKLTDVRSPGSTVYNSNVFPAAFSMASWQYVQNSAERVRVLLDGQDDTIYDATAGQKSTIFVKGIDKAQARMVGVNTELFIGDGGEQKKFLDGSITWSPTAPVNPGQLIKTVNAGAAYMQMALGGLTMKIVATETFGGVTYIYTNQQNVPLNLANLLGVSVTFAGLTTATGLNGNTYPINAIPSGARGIFTVSASLTNQVYLPDTGTAGTGNGITGGSAPAFSTTEFSVVQDAGQQWKCYGSALENWGIAPPVGAPILVPQNGTRFWLPAAILSQYYAILDTNGFIEMAAFLTAGASAYTTGLNYPTWITGATAGYNTTYDGTIGWNNLGQPGTWVASSTAFSPVPLTGIACILDSNQNLQWCSVAASATGATVPTWNATIGGSTTDGGVTWICLGPGVVLAANSVGYAYSYHGIDGTVCTASNTATIPGGILGVTQTANVGRNPYLLIEGVIENDTQIDQLWIWRTAVGQSTLIFEDQIPADNGGSNPPFQYLEFGIPDTSTNGQIALNPLIPAPINDSADPPPVGALPMCFAFQRLWYAVADRLYYTAGPDAITGNGLTQCPPLNVIPFLGTVYAVRPVTVQNGGLLVFTSAGIQIVLGLGTTSNPFYPTTYYGLVNVCGFNAVSDLVGTTLFVMESNLKVSSISVEYPFNPSTGYTEVGFPVGDQFVKATTGGQNSALFDPSTACVSWNNQSTSENALYVSNAAGFWRRLSAISPPESGFMWATLRQIGGGSSAVQALKTAPKTTTQLLIAPAAGMTGPLLCRDNTGAVYTDNGAAYPSYDTKGVMLLCSTGQWSEVAHIGTKSAAVGARPAIGVLFNEIEAIPTSGSGYSVLKVSGPDPVRGRVSKSVFSDRYDLEQMGEETLGDSLLIRFDYGTQAVADELLDFGIYASVDDERQEGASK